MMFCRIGGVNMTPINQKIENKAYRGLWALWRSWCLWVLWDLADLEELYWRIIDDTD